MKKLGLLAISVILFSSIAFGQDPKVRRSFDLSNAKGLTSDATNIAGLGLGAHIFTWSLQSGVMSSCTVSFQTSPDNKATSTWTEQSTGDCSSNGQTGYLVFTANFVRVKATTFLTQSGTALVTVNLNSYIIPPTTIAAITTAPLTNQNVNGLYYCDNFTGATVTLKLDACISGLPSSGGTGLVISTATGEPTTLPSNSKMFLDTRGTIDLLTESTTKVVRPVNWYFRSNAGALKTRSLTGTVTFTNGSTTVSGSSTAFSSELTAGDTIRLTGDAETAYGKIATVNSNISVTLSSVYTGTGGAGTGVVGLAHLVLAIRNNVTGGSPNTSGAGESVGFSVLSYRTSGNRVVFGGNLNTTFANKTAGASALELNLNNTSGSDWNINGETLNGELQEAYLLRLVTAGTARVQGALLCDAASSSINFQMCANLRGWNTYGIKSTATTTGGVHFYSIPFQDDTNLSFEWRNTANAQDVATVNNQGSAWFRGVLGSPAGGLTSSTKQLHAYASANSLQIPLYIENDQGGTGSAALGFLVNQTSLSGGTETRTAKGGVGYVRGLANGRGTLNFYNRATNDTSDFTTSDVVGSFSNAGVFNVPASITSPQLTLSSKLTLGSEDISNVPRMTFSCFFPGTLDSLWTGCTFKPDKAITITRGEAQVKTIANTCTTSASIHVDDGSTTAVDMLVGVTAATDSGAIVANYAAGAAITIKIAQAAATCVAKPADMNVIVEYKMQ